MQIPENLKYTRDHEWVRLEGTVATIGITEFAQSELGDIVFVELPAPGKIVKQKDALCVVESTKAASDVYSPIGGTVLEVNKTLSDKPELINSHSYTDGWMVKLTNPAQADLATLMSAFEYRKLLGDKAS